jgi:hypothetical protein
MLGLLTDVKVDADEIGRPLAGVESTLSSQLVEKIKYLKGSGQSSVNFVKSPLSKGFNLVSEGVATSDDEMEPLPRTILSDNGDANVGLSHDQLSRNMKSAATYNRPGNQKSMSRAQTNAQYRRTHLSQG